MDTTADEHCPLHELRARFCKLWERCAPSDTMAAPEPVWTELIRLYSQPERQYHTPRHLCHCLQQLDLASALMEDPGAVEIALWFHDIIFEPDAPDNEAQSAALFRRAADKQFPQDCIDKVSDMILATVHCEPPQAQDARYLCDIDLSSLGFPWERFLEDSAAVRAEQTGTTDAQFYSAKIRFFSSLLERPSIFLTDFFRNRYERGARENMQHHIVQLGAQGHT